MSFILPATFALQAPAPGGASGIGQLFMFSMIGIIFWFILIRPQQRQRKQHEDALRALKRGDRVVTAGGIIAEVIHIKEASKDGKPAPGMDDEVTIKSGDTRIIVERGRIGKIMGDAGSSTAAPTNK